jgi:hypothetical protein
MQERITDGRRAGPHIDWASGVAILVVLGATFVLSLPCGEFTFQTFTTKAQGSPQNAQIQLMKVVAGCGDHPQARCGAGCLTVAEKCSL